ncbi:MAG TPA: metalloregulator ArsR/SmtB family transcription factor [Puia sp.]|jgi:DNA-binding transcriptional ArsR family regulator|nr:metalloregulator ArsR/SmtB family transcription factor [Puia sp.]
MDTRRDVFQAIADPTRRKIINMIADNPQHLNAIAENFDVSRQAISLHIKILTECGLIDIKQQGRQRYCSIQPQKLSEVADWIEPFRKMWEGHLDRLGKVMKEREAKKKNL